MGIFFVIFGVAALLIGAAILTAIVRGISEWSRNNASPRLTFPARVVAKRTHVSGGSGNSSASTRYYITFERIEDGARQEFRVDTKAYSSLAEGDHGDLTHQGTRFGSFARKPAPAPPAVETTPREIRFCAYCGHQVAQDNNKCPGCGSLWRPNAPDAA